MTKHLLTKMIVLLSFFGIAMALKGEPIDVEVQKKIPELVKIQHNVRQQGRISSQDHVVLEQNLASNDDVLVSLAAYAIGESKQSDMDLCAKAEDVLNPTSPLRKSRIAKAFIQLMLVKKSTVGKKASEQIAAIESLLNDANPILQVEAAKELLKKDARRGEDALRIIFSTNDSPFAKAEAYRQLNKIGKAANLTSPPIPLATYTELVSIIEKAQGK